MGSFWKIVPIGGQVLRDEVQLPNAGRREPLRFPHEIVHRAGLLRPAKSRNDAKRAGVVAAFRDLQVAAPAPRAPHAWGLGIVGVVRRSDDRARATEDLPDLQECAGSQEVVHLGKFPGERLAVALRKTPGDHQLPSLPPGLDLGELEDGLDALLLRGTDERAGIDDQDIGVFGILGHVVALALQRSEHHLAVHAILGAAEGDEMDLLLHP